MARHHQPPARETRRSLSRSLIGRRISPLDHAVRLIHRICQLAGPKTFLRGRASLGAEDVRAAIRNHDTAVLFDLLIDAVSYQGISDRIAADFMERHGQASWRDIDADLGRNPTCPKLKSYWHFYDCQYNKTRYTCAEPDHLPRCPLPNYWLRNGRLNQTGYALFLFIRDVADGDVVGWIDGRISRAIETGDETPTEIARSALITPLREVYGVSDKVLAMALSNLLLAASLQIQPRWAMVGASMIAVDTLVHNFLHRTGILRRFRADHAYGPGCYRPGGCADIIETVAERIDARQFNRRFPSAFPRFVQFAIWRYCAQDELNICNGNQINDRKRCTNNACSLYSICDRKTLYIAKKRVKSDVL
jgi:hypothetical protein